MEVPDSTVRFNMNCTPVTPGFLAQIACELEKGNPVYIEHAALPVHGPGATAFLLGYRYAQTEKLHDELYEADTLKKYWEK